MFDASRTNGAHADEVTSNDATCSRPWSRRSDPRSDRDSGTEPAARSTAEHDDEPGASVAVRDRWSTGTDAVASDAAPIDTDPTAAAESDAVPVDADLTAAVASDAVPVDADAVASDTGPIDADLTAAVESDGAPIDADLTAAVESDAAPIDADLTAAVESDTGPIDADPSDTGRIGAVPIDADAVGPFHVGEVAVTDDVVLADWAADLERRRTALDAETAVVLAELEARAACDREYGLTTGGWLAREAHLPFAVSKARVTVAAKLRTHFGEVLDALTAGTISWEHARVIVEVANPRIIDIVAANQEMILGLADRCRFEHWRAEVRALARLWDQDGSYDPNEDPAKNRLSYGTTIDGLTTLAATLTGENAEVVTQAIEAKADELHRRAVADRAACSDLEIPSRSTLRALALTELIRQALGIDLDRTKGPITEVTMVIKADDPTSATDPDGVPLADGTTRLLSCDAAIHALIVDRLGVPLDLGRHVRWASEPQRRAARNRDGGCTFPGCGARVAWCDIHHCIHDEHGGATDLCNLVCLCRHHHGVTHRTGWHVLVDADGWAVFRSASGTIFWGQRHGRQRAGPPPDPSHWPRPGARHPVSHADHGSVVFPSRDRPSPDPRRTG